MKASATRAEHRSCAAALAPIALNPSDSSAKAIFAVAGIRPLSESAIRANRLNLSSLFNLAKRLRNSLKSGVQYSGHP
jgi:hypothetical protein